LVPVPRWEEAEEALQNRSLVEGEAAQPLPDRVEVVEVKWNLPQEEVVALAPRWEEVVVPAPRR